MLQLTVYLLKSIDKMLGTFFFTSVHLQNSSDILGMYMKCKIEISRFSANSNFSLMFADHEKTTKRCKILTNGVIILATQ